MAYDKNIGAKHYTLSSSTSSLKGDYIFTVTHQIVQWEGKGQGIVAYDLIRAEQWICTSHKTAWLLDAHYYQQFLRSIPVDIVCEVIQWAYVQDMGIWYEEDLLITVDLHYGSYCNGAYVGASNIMVAAETGCDAK